MVRIGEIVDDFEEILFEEFSELELGELEASSFFGIINCCNTVKPDKTTLH